MDKYENGEDFKKWWITKNIDANAWLVSPPWPVDGSPRRHKGNLLPSFDEALQYMKDCVANEVSMDIPPME